MNNQESFGRYGLPLNIQFCKKCAMNNQRPSSTVEFKNKPGEIKKAIFFDEHGVCDACNFAEKKKLIDWSERERELRELCDRHRRNDGRYDVVVPGSGGKDSVMAAHVLKFKYNMNPILVTWPPAIYTDIGRRNFDAWLNAGFANYTYNQNKRVHRTLTRLAFEKLCHPFQPFILGQKNLAPKMSVMLDIPLVVFGENEAEYGNAILDNDKPTRDPKYYTAENQLGDLYLGGVSASHLMEEYKYSMADLEAYLPVDPYKIQSVGTEVHYLGYYMKWHPQETYYFSVEHSDFMPNDHRTEGSFSKYSSLDDMIDWLHYYTTYTKFGIGRATYDAAQEIRNGDITRDEGISLIKRFDGEFPEIYQKQCLEYMGISAERFAEVIEEFRTPHLWDKTAAGWELKKPIWKA
ncbi:N-acetyl sugar amidotransferase [Pseudomonas sp. PDM04]|jgi:N-acetyl sugar amidotransferase|uniref:N-acetyl sugar amidotransferase n=1 Tax=Pseudomonas sp. PDM04 TaxID=2769296 RepID=UPI0017841439|nr:N-acetyl sugar amidotransferase [Pseudomonas sp. PDM04]MBD9438715.1 N-acetyl sugar amidotransferase [Pseudomonas sp. PDM04]